MSALRLVFATALVFLALFLIAGQIMLPLVDDEGGPMPPLQHVVLSALALCSLLTAYYYSRPGAHWASQLQCPQCHEKGVLALSTLRRPRVNAGAHLLGGWLGTLLYSHARKRGYVCGACQAPTELRTFGGWVAMAWLVLVALAVVVELYLGE